MARGSSLKRGEVWWARLPPPDKTRPVVLVSRDDSYAVRDLLIAVRVTTRARGIHAEVALGPGEGLLRPSVANCDDIITVSKGVLAGKVGSVGEDKLAEVDRALKFALGLD